MIACYRCFAIVDGSLLCRTQHSQRRVFFARKILCSQLQFNRQLRIGSEGRVFFQVICLVELAFHDTCSSAVWFRFLNTELELLDRTF